MILKMKNIQFQNWTFALYLLIISFLAYGLLVPYIGYSFDDWPNAYVLSTNGNLWEYLKFDRPFSAWTFLVTKPILGLDPLGWHILIILLRWFTSLGMLWILMQVWPENKKAVYGMVAIFTISPAFTQMASAITYSQQLTTYALCLLSIGSMLASMADTRGRIWFIGLGLISAVGHVFTMEYFWGLELVRSLFVWFALRGITTSQTQRLKSMIKISWPYLLILLLAIVWRQLFFIPIINLDNPINYSPVLINAVFTDPISGIASLSNTIVKDLHYLFVTMWANTLQPKFIDTTSLFLNVSWLLTLGVIIGSIFYFQRTKFENEDEKTNFKYNWRKESFILGFSIIVFGTIPYWITAEQITVGLFSDRFSLAGMLGAAILSVGFIYTISQSGWKATALVSILVGFGVGYHFRISNDYRWEWAEQRDFYWQLYWRAPQIEPHTPIYSEGAIFPYTGDYPTAFAINTLYNRSPASTDLSYWFSELDEKFYKDSKRMLAGLVLEKGLRNYHFYGNSLDGIVIHHAPENGNCLWILDSSDSKNQQLPELVRNALPLSNLERISRLAPNSTFHPNIRIFGPELPHTWCYFYQKAKLAAQNGEWNKIVLLAQEIEKLGLTPNNRIEWVPFIRAFAYTNEWEKAKTLTISAYKTDVKNRKYYCSIWKDFESFGPNEEISGIYEKLDCPQQ